jgi:DNA invertase Pin-like site-specific DNA recombinase
MPEDIEPYGIRAVIYCRVSTEDQAKEGFSLSAQEERLKAYCTAKNWTVVRTYIDDGYSGRSDDRPAYKDMMSKRDEWDVMVVLKMDRIHRNSKNFTLMMEELKRTGKEFTSMQESFDTTTAMGRFVMDIIQRIAQLESEQIGERVYIGMQQKAKEGKGILGFNIPFGYTIIDHGLVIEPDEAIHVEWMFTAYLSGMSLRDICEDLKARGIRTKKQKRWYPVTVHKILSNPVYCGYHRWEDIIYKGANQSIVTIETFEDVQASLHKRMKNFIAKIPRSTSSMVMGS